MLDILSNLNQQQHQAVTAGEGQVLVLAGPGSGKTRVLTQRIAHLIHTHGVPPYRILAMTFTNKAAREMQNRVESLLGCAQPDIWLGTFHAICARLLRREAAVLPFTTSFVIMDSDDQVSLVRQALKTLNLDEKQYRPQNIHGSISKAKNDLVLPETFVAHTYRDEIVKRVYTLYQKMLLDNNALDFDDILLWAVRLFQENPAILDKYRQRFAHILVDEFQDTNMPQYALLVQLAGDNGNILVVGDEDQSIYRWRGADYRNVQRFERDYPACQKILLEQNYRSTQTVLDAARAIIDRNQNRTPKLLTSARGAPGDRILLYEANDDYAEAAYVIETIAQLVSSKKARGGDFSVMYRTNSQSRLLEEAFLRSGMPYRLVGAQRFYGRREVKDIIAYLRLVQNPCDEISLGRAINTPPRGIGEKTIAGLLQAARQAGCTAGEALLDIGKNGAKSSLWASFSGRAAASLADFGILLASWRDFGTKSSLPALFDRILADIYYKSHIDDGSEEGVDRWENVQELRRLAYEYQDRGLTDFLENIALVSDQDTVPENPDVPTLLTLHAAKGLEFERVFITGLDEGLLPHSRARDDPEEMAEERRLFYVGLTRAKNQVYLVRADRRSSYGSYENSISSRFLEDIPENLLRRQGTGQARREERHIPSPTPRWEGSRIASPPARVQSNISWNSSRPTNHAPTPAAQPSYKPTMRVKHPTWGEGVILESRIEDGEETVDVHFASVGFKKLIASLAKLEILS